MNRCATGSHTCRKPQNNPSRCSAHRVPCSMFHIPLELETKKFCVSLAPQIECEIPECFENVSEPSARSPLVKESGSRRTITVTRIASTLCRAVSNNLSLFFTIFGSEPAHREKFCLLFLDQSSKNPRRHPTISLERKAPLAPYFFVENTMHAR